MASHRSAPTLSLRLWFTLAATVVAFVASLLASLNLYLLEDNNPLTQAVYSAAPVLRWSYDGVYVSALVATVAVCAIVAYALTQADVPVVISLIIIALLVALAGFGGLLVRQPTTFLLLFLVFAGLALVSLLPGRAVATWSRHFLSQRSAAMVGACVRVGIALLVNVVALVLHTLALNPVSHPLFMQGQIGQTHFNSLVIAMGIELLALVIFVLGIGFALQFAKKRA